MTQNTIDKTVVEDFLANSDLGELVIFFIKEVCTEAYYGDTNLREADLTSEGDKIRWEDEEGITWLKVNDYADDSAFVEFITELDSFREFANLSAYAKAMMPIAG
jgi:hypothetical protein